MLGSRWLAAVFTGRIVQSHALDRTGEVSFKREPYIPVLRSLSFTTLPKTGDDPVQQRRAKFVARLEEHSLLLWKRGNHAIAPQLVDFPCGEPQKTGKHV